MSEIRAQLIDELRNADVTWMEKREITSLLRAAAEAFTAERDSKHQFPCGHFVSRIRRGDGTYVPIDSSQEKCLPCRTIDELRSRLSAAAEALDTRPASREAPPPAASIRLREALARVAAELGRHDMDGARWSCTGCGKTNRNAVTKIEHDADCLWYEIDAALRSAEAPPPASNGWQAIETYPPDAGEVLLYGMRRFSVGIATGAWNRGDNMVMPHWMSDIRSPTHWMPLPLPPLPERRTPADDPERT